MENKYDSIAVGKRIKQAMKDADMTAFVLSRNSGMTTTSIYNYIAGVNVPSLDSAMRLAEALGVSVDWLATGK